MLIVFGDIHGARRSCSCLGLTWPRWHSSRKSLKLDYTGCMIFSECLARQVPAAPPKSCCVRHLVPASRYWYDRRPRETEEVQEAQKEACQHSTVDRFLWFELHRQERNRDAKYGRWTKKIGREKVHLIVHSSLLLLVVILRPATAR